ncbi:unnamed protein product [Brachionus calyciflorus]|uniref:ISXO2-like transposase domain-containing protein n=1 Tax=Brachionus calyciflorus TaxID=104777 RepID=A0A814M205_9BILA|nr:unnamed protein product [Brachionus calyciflorus]
MTLLSKPIELYNLKEVIDLNQADILEWLKFKGVFPSTKNCSKCGKSMKLIQRNDSIDGFSWRCTTDSKRCSLRDGTYLQNSRIDVKTFLKIVYFWAFQIRQVDQVSMISVDRHTIITYQQKLRHLAISSFDIESIKLGGEGKVVEIDESLFVKVKHNKGKDLKRPQIWVFGLYERGTKLVLFIIVPKRDAYNLLNVIYKFVLPKTIIYSDCWRAYTRIRDLDKNFEHFTVNHNLFFVNPENGVHTNSIESVWNSAKVHIKLMRGVSRDYLQSYLLEFCWRRSISRIATRFKLIKDSQSCIQENENVVSVINNVLSKKGEKMKKQPVTPKKYNLRKRK